MFLTAVNLARGKSKTILVQMVSAAGTGYCFNTKRNRLREKLVLRKHDPKGEGAGAGIRGCALALSGWRRRRSPFLLLVPERPRVLIVNTGALHVLSSSLSAQNTIKQQPLSVIYN
nr:PREDICTED: 39S ribosomal protein L33, mitochondrial isoform X1 [Lepisosteus oculatus]XP_015212366.1 PREDICTED: 39S ribosomal protein L33, mitochondrial isoform X2 [Lepisosteus oculatus]